ncbi:MAG TPA: hypothetical protein VKT33_08500 [Candidatus Angelobacter sp.]|nr:hypothetical protein [Candidatus Angelobacter sp.]
MTDSISGKPAPQFSTAEYAENPGANTCQVCGQPAGPNYYRLGDAVSCRNCAHKLKASMTQDNHALFMRSIVLGIGGAIVGMALYSGFTILTGIYIGYVSLAVGFIIAKAMMLGSKGVGGRHYQIAAVLLTYAAVSLSAVPIALAQIAKHRNHAPSHQTQIQPSSSPTSNSAEQPASPEQTSADAPAAKAESHPSRPDLGTMIGKLFFIGLASPFLELQDGFNGVIGLVILFVGIRIAWKMTAG